MNRKCQKPFVILLCLFWPLISPQAQEIDEETGLIISENWELVKTNCTVCHSAQNVIKQQGTRLTWLGLIRWMQETQGLWTFEAETENKILDYLETNYGPNNENYRRAPIPPFLMPPNPYKTQATIQFVGLQEFYQQGDSLNIEVNVDFQAAYTKGYLDLWVAVHLPNRPDSEFIFLTETPSFTPEPQPFRQSLNAKKANYAILKNFTLPALDKGEYTFYALAVEEEVNPLQNFEGNRSDLIIQTVTIQ